MCDSAAGKYKANDEVATAMVWPPRGRWDLARAPVSGTENEKNEGTENSKLDM